jgi:PIN domain nuclease of toxin-antitoxin system
VSTYVVDTHALVWFLSQDPRLSETAYAILRDPTARLIIPVIVLAEIKYLGYKSRFAQTLDNVMRIIEADSRCVIYPVDLDVVRRAPADMEIHDALIVGTALMLSPAADGILTRDEAIRISGFAPVIW